MVKRLSPRQICFSLAVNTILRRNQRLSSFDKRYVYMLTEDVANGIVPFRHTPNVNFRANLTTSSNEAGSLVREAFDGRARYEFGETVAEFFRESAKTLLYFGREFYYVHPVEGNGLRFKIRRVDPVLFYQRRCRFGRSNQQLAPHLHLQRLSGIGWVEVALPGGVKGIYRQMMMTLARLSGDVLPSFATEVQVMRRVHFDIAHYKSVEIRDLLRATKEIGWSVRGRLSSEVLEYYVLERFLRFEEFKARLRLQILNGLNEVLRIAGEKGGFSAKIELEGIASCSDVARARDDLRTGSKPFREVIQPFLWY
jgi:hypothetical protein